MGVSTKIAQVIENNRSRLTEGLKIKQFLVDLRNKKVLNDDDVDEIQLIDSVKSQNDRFVRILESRDDAAFYAFCDLLKKNQAASIMNLGRDLLQHVNTGESQGAGQGGYQPRPQEQNENQTRLQQEMDITDAKAHQALKTFAKEFVRFVPVDDILFDLELKGIIREREKTDLRNCPHRDEKAQNLFEILYKKGTADDFKAFCQLLQEHSVTSTQRFGNQLLDKAKSI